MPTLAGLLLGEDSVRKPHLAELSGLSIYQPVSARGQGQSPCFTVFYGCFLECVEAANAV